ncbi:MAG: hypothetical protein F4X60_13565 [Gemmatimonadetes bacterium]|nr:hypothetical protein [Gemmatimonadota bacterium]MYB99565.1 hypothetical protein [Gemmatimonadota bacterium]
MEQRRDFDLDAQVAEWRRWQERTSSLTPRELDELQDHLRAHVDLELELNATLGPAQAFHVACKEIGPARVLSKEFAKVGKARWRRVFLTGWAMYAVSFLLPSAEFSIDHGYQWLLQVTLADLRYPQILAFDVLPNLAMLMTIPVFLGLKPPSGRCLKWILGLAGIGAMGAAVFISGLFAFIPENRGLWEGIARFGTGYWTWATSLAAVATALHLRAREWASAKPRAAASVSGQGVFQ